MSQKSNGIVAVVMGSDSDWATMENCVKMLQKFGIPYQVRVISAHRTPRLAQEFAENAAKQGIKIIVAAAGAAAHLPGVLASYTTLPIIGVPMKGGAMDGMDAMLSMVQMPAGVPVATVALGQAGATNAAVLAAQILALSDAAIADKLNSYKEELAQKVIAGNAKVNSLLEKSI